MSKAIYAFSGDPITFGHLDIIHRAVKIFDQVIVAIGVNPEKKYMFSLAEREQLAKVALKHLATVKVKSFQGLLVDFAYEMGAQVIVKGVRSNEDFNYEQTLHQMSDSQNLGIDTVFFFARPELAHISSSAAKQLQKEQGLIQNYVPLNVKQALESKISEQYIVGVTGEIGAGKSFVCQQFVELGKQQQIPVHHIEMDLLGHEILSSLKEPKYLEVRQQIKKVFGADVAQKDGTINRKKLGEVVFNDQQKLKELNKLMYQPLMVRLRKALYGKKGLILLNAALIVEADLVELCNNNVVLVKANKNIQQQRLAERGLSPDQVKRRLASAYSSDKKHRQLLKSLDQTHHGQVWSIDNSGPQSKTQIKQTFKQIINYFHLQSSS